MTSRATKAEIESTHHPQPASHQLKPPEQRQFLESEWTGLWVEKGMAAAVYCTTESRLACLGSSGSKPKQGYEN